ncbi:MAG: ABC transporter ATP-binding protein [Desulfovibrio sp.]|nr:ABC transporter ATP-binding protein [Desulfovibrio sp.]
MSMPDAAPFLVVKNLCKSYPERKPSGWGVKMRPILKDVSFSVRSGEILGLLGESGSGKSTLSRCILGLEAPDSGEVLFEGQAVRYWHVRHRGACSVVFQDYVTSVNPGFRVRDIIAEGCRAGGGGNLPEEGAVAALMERVQLPSRLAESLPHQLSGGQLQRVCIARALASNPYFIVFDEAVSALDVSIQAQILDLLRNIKGDMTYLFITHDIQMATLLCDRFLLLRNGELTATVECAAMYSSMSPYLQELMDSTIVFSSEYSETPTAAWEPYA